MNTNGSSLSSLTTAQQNARRASQILRQTRLESRRLSNAERQNTTKIFTRIKNPLVGVPREALLQDVEEFARANNLNDVLPLLKKGAIAAQVQYAEAIQALPELDEDEKQNLAEEITHKWRHPAILYFTIILNSIAGVYRKGHMWATANAVQPLSRGGIKPVRTVQICRGRPIWESLTVRSLSVWATSHFVRRTRGSSGLSTRCPTSPSSSCENIALLLNDTQG